MSSFHVQRSIRIAVSQERVFDTLADFSTWKTWSPWLCAQPDAKVTVSQNSSDVGSLYAWEGDVVGAGEIEHQQLDKPHRIEDEIRFRKPFRSVSKVVFDMETVDGQTQLTWHMHGSLPFFLFWMRPMMETMIGMDFERGLKMLKEWLETGRIESQTLIRGVVTVGPIQMLGVRSTASLAEISSATENAIRQATALFKAQHLPTHGEMISVYHRFDMKAARFDFTSGYVVADLRAGQGSGLSHWSMARGQALCVEHVGSYQNLGNAWSAANQIARYKKLKQCKTGAFELYKTTPPNTPPAELRTEIYLPLR